MRRVLGLVAFAFAVACAPLASAQAPQAYLNVQTTLLSGPSPDYPPIVALPYGTYLTVYGCTAGFQWCDVSSGYNRGWVPGNYILYPYQGTPVLLPSYGPQFGVPIIAFSIGAYWGAHYQHRAFYRDRNRWYARPPPMARPPMPPPRPPNGWRPPPPRPPGHRPPSNVGHRPPSHRPPSRPGGNQRPPSSGHGQRPPLQRPPAQPGQRPPSNIGSRPPQGNGNRPPQHGNQRPPQGTGNRPPAQTRPAPASKPASAKPKKPGKPRSSGNT